MEKNDTKFRKTIAVEKRLVVALSRLSTGSSYRTISKIFVIEKSIISIITVIAAFPFGQLSILETFSVLHLSISLVTLFVLSINSGEAHSLYVRCGT